MREYLRVAGVVGFFVTAGLLAFSPQSQPTGGKSIVYVTKRGDKFHRKDCQYLKGDALDIALADALRWKYEPCSKCNPQAGGSADEKKPKRVSDVVYGRKDGLSLTLDVFFPIGKPNGAAVVLVASGGFNSSVGAVHRVFADSFVKRGYTCFYVVHGSQPRYTVPEIRADINRAVRFVRFHAKKYGIEPDRIGIGGVSSGGLLALLVGTAPQAPKADADDPVDRAASNVQAVAVFFPPTDYLNYGTKDKNFLEIKDHGIAFRAAHDFYEFDEKEGLRRPITDKDKLHAIYKDISPIYHVTVKTAPTLIFHGDKDELVPFQQSEMYYAKLKEAGVASKLEVRKGAGHGWFSILDDLNLVADWYDLHLKGG
ncbi:MAG: alpha/beta hydrolase [Planctomycetes bacterium]|nr:alpha/beta hydrolase [Planctomycetota bacterium]